MLRIFVIYDVENWLFLDVTGDFFKGMQITPIYRRAK